MKKPIAVGAFLGLAILGGVAFWLVDPALTHRKNGDEYVATYIGVLPESQVSEHLERARSGDVQAMVDLAYHYTDDQIPNVPENANRNMFTGQDQNSRRARYWANRAIDSGSVSMASQFQEYFLREAKSQQDTRRKVEYLATSLRYASRLNQCGGDNPEFTCDRYLSMIAETSNEMEKLQ